MILDVGCGNHPRGNVNCDLFIGRTPHLHGKGLDNFINPKLIQNFVRCDAHYLPFKDSAFTEVYSSHLLEHLDNPTKGLKEMVRVSGAEITFLIPHRIARVTWFHYSQCKMHKHFFNVTNVVYWLKRLGLTAVVSVNMKGFPHLFVPIIQLPWEIKVTIRKGELS